MDLDRRSFLRQSALLGLVAFLPALPFKNLVRAEGFPDLSVVQGPDPDVIVRSAIEAVGGIGRFISKGDIVVVKPNIGWDRKPELGANTHPQVVASVVRLCFEAGAKTVTVLDNPCDDARRTYVQSGIAEAARASGAKTPFMDDRKFRKVSLNGETLKNWDVYEDIIEADKVINVPVAKHHSSAGLTLSMKNWMGAIGGWRARLHWKLDESLVDLAGFFKPTLTILDCVRILTTNGPQGGSLSYVKTLNTVVVGTDQVAVDALGASLFEAHAGRPESVERARRYIAKAAARGIGRMDIENMEIARRSLG